MDTYQRPLLFIASLFFLLCSTTSALAYSNGSLISSTKINESTTNGPALGINNGYGWSITGIGDLDNDGVADIAAGRTGDASGVGIGGVFIHFMNSDGSIKSTAQITSTTTNGPTLVTGDTYGYSVADIGDLNNDGVADIAVGSYGNDMGGAANTNRGAIFIHYMNRDGSVLSTVKIGQGTTNGPTLALNDHYGGEIANIGDLDNDGINDIAVGALNDDTGGADRGAFYIHYMNRDGSIKSTVKIAHGTTNGATLANSNGYGSVGALGDLDADGIPDIASGANGGTGAVYIHYMNRNGSIKSTVKLDSTTANSSVTISTGYGIRVKSPGDLDGDGIPDMVVGAFGDDTGGTDRGAIYIHYMNRNGSIKSSVKIANGTTNGPTMVNNTYYGTGLGVAGDINNDGSVDIAAGVPYDNGVRGAMYLHLLTATPGITVSETSLTATEGQVGDTFTVVLNSKPANGVTVGISIVSSEVSLSTSSLTFDSTNWNEPQIVTVTAIDDTDREASHNDTLSFTVTSSDANYNGMSLSTIPVTVLDNDAPDVVNSKTSLSVTEGVPGTFTTVLNSQPTHDVTIALNLPTDQATLSTASLVFTTVNWNVPQTVTITPVDDAISESTVNTAVSFSVTSSDTEYNAMSVSAVSVSVVDNDSFGVAVSESSFAFLEGESDTYTVVLNTQPTHDVTVQIGLATNAVTVSSSTLVFTTATWNVPQTVTVSTTDNSTVDTPQTDTISFTLTSTDSSYNALSVTSISVTITDNDSSGFVVSPSSITLTESGGSALSVRLSSQPSASVVVTVSVSTGQTSTSADTLTFTTSNWATPQSVTITALNDGLPELSQTDTVSFAVSSSDSSYNGISITPIAVTITDPTRSTTIIRSTSGYLPSRKIIYPQTTTSTALPMIFSKPLKLGVQDQDVQRLQKFLNDRGFIITETGAGSPGKETVKFGSLTKKAVIQFQKAYTIKPLNGIFGPTTMAAANTLLKQ